jgi:hypothetical protein
MHKTVVLTMLSLFLVVEVQSAQARLATDAVLWQAQGGHARIIEFRPRAWDVHGCDYSSGWVNTSPQRHKLIYAHTMESYIVGVGRLQPNGRWAIWERIPFSDNPDVRVGTVVRRSATRWDILHKGRKIGYAVGPDGPEAVTALLTICQL